MRKLFITILLLTISSGFSQAGAPANPYYNGFNFNQTGSALKQALAQKITDTHTNILTYTQAQNAIRFTDLDPDDDTKTNLLLVYGFGPFICTSENSNETTTENDDRRRNKNFDGVNSCQWNREHTFAKSLGSPNLGDFDAGADVHHLRPADVERNADRGNKKFATGSGNSGTVGSDWYPGDEWKGDIARMMMYMYLRYGDQCLPINVGTGNAIANDPAMIDLFLNWNAEDPVSQFEDNRNTYLGNISNFYAQGNRNPFIDNPYLATLIWGGVKAENRWLGIYLSTSSFDVLESVVIHPNPTNTNRITIETALNIDTIELITLNGQLIQKVNNPLLKNQSYSLENLSQGFYFLKLTSNNQSVVKKLIVN